MGLFFFSVLKGVRMGVAWAPNKEPLCQLARANLLLHFRVFNNLKYYLRMIGMVHRTWIDKSWSLDAKIIVEIV